ncbi:hypothetical protein RCL_jg13016.t2 [Rhizophagus clarus]|uniref:Uncharacterized protein n=1 Tax=Rhizophagus clarus TaxID=94130 RepID=A0A8H3QCQ3_9GLOM|nr:hypothetical protein RCL_jg13016.t2 [Rhizophagus clarus]
MILLLNVFYGRRLQVGPIVFLTDDLSAECHSYPLLQKHFKKLWECHQFWALSFQAGLSMHVQFITISMKRFCACRLLAIANNHPGYLQISRWFLIQDVLQH